MTRQAVDLLIAEMDEAWESLYGRLEGLTDDEFFWEPVMGCWTVHLGRVGRIFWTMILHDLHHGAEIGCLRDLYRVTYSEEKAP